MNLSVLFLIGFICGTQSTTLDLRKTAYHSRFADNLPLSICGRQPTILDLLKTTRNSRKYKLQVMNCSKLDRHFLDNLNNSSGHRTATLYTNRQREEREYTSNCIRPKCPRYVDLESRRQSFIGWPRKYFTQDPEDLARCGFFYTGTADRVTCFCCGVTVRHWMPGQEPSSRHLSLSPECSFVRSLHHDELSRIPLQSYSQTGGTESSGTTNASDHVVQKVMNMGFSKEQVSVVTAKHGGKVFDVADLIEAILVLEQEESSVEVPGPENYQPNRTTQYNMSGNEASTNLTEQLKSNPNSSLDSAAGGSVTEKPNADLPSLAEGGQAPESGSERNHQTRNDKGRETSMDVLNKQSHFDNQKSADAVTGKENCQMDEIKNENLHLKTQRMCRRCRLEESVMLCLPCGHIASCVDCIGKTDKCFVCSTKILGTVRTYLA